MEGIVSPARLKQASSERAQTVTGWSFPIESIRKLVSSRSVTDVLGFQQDAATTKSSRASTSPLIRRLYGVPAEPTSVPEGAGDTGPMSDSDDQSESTALSEDCFNADIKVVYSSEWDDIPDGDTDALVHEMSQHAVAASKKSMAMRRWLQDQR